MSIVLDGTTGVTANGLAVLTTNSSLPAANLTGVLPAVDGSALVNLPSPPRPPLTLAEYGTLNATAADTYTLSEPAISITTIRTTVTSTTYLPTRSILINGISGSIRLQNSALHGNYQTAYLRLLKNGVQVAEFISTGSTPILRTVDVAVQPNDLLEWQARGSDTISLYTPWTFSANEKASDNIAIKGVYAAASTV
jgi:hypothetical protein